MVSLREVLPFSMATKWCQCQCPKSELMTECEWADAYVQWGWVTQEIAT